MCTEHSRQEICKAYKGSSSDLKGSITVFLSLSLALTAALFLSLLESVRTQGARLYLTSVCNSAIDSLFSQYHLGLWADYRLLGLEHYSDEQLSEEFRDFADPYFEAKNFYGSEIKEVSIIEKKLITDDEGEVFEDQVLKYMKYGIVATVMESDLVQKLTGNISDGLSLFEFQDSYGDHTKAAVRLEERLEDISASIDRQKEHLDEVVAAGNEYDSIRARRGLSKLRAEVKKIPELVDAYKKDADKLRSELEESRKEYVKNCNEGKLSETARKQLEAELEKYDSYVAADGERRQEIEKLSGQAADNILFIDELVMEIEHIEEQEAIQDEEEDIEVNRAELWEGFNSRISAYNALELGLRKGIEDKEKEKKLEDVEGLLELDLLKLLLPEGMVPDKTKLELENAPSRTEFSGVDESRRGILDRIFMAEYMAAVLNHYGRGDFDDGRTQKGSGGLELEYVLYGSDSDYDSLSQAISDLVALRSGLNLLHILSDSEKRAQAQNLAFMISGALGFTPIVGIMTFFIMSVWALGQALCDVKALLAGKKVSFMHTRESFALSLDGLLDMASGKVVENKDDDKGFSYLDYMKLFLVMKQGSEQDYRCMDMIQLALSKGQSDFLINRCAASASISSSYDTRHIFTSLGLVKYFSGNDLTEEYDISVQTAFGY